MEKRCTVGVLVGNANSPHAMSLISGISKTAKKLGVNLLFYLSVHSTYVYHAYINQESEEDYEYQYNVIYEYAGVTSPDVLIMTYGTLSTFLDNKDKFSFVERFHDIPYVLTEEHDDSGRGSSVISDNYHGMYQLTEHLVKDHGYRDITFLGGPPGNTDAIERRMAVEDVLARYGIPFDESRVEHGDFSECVTQQVGRLLDRFPHMQAMICANDQMAETAYRVCESRGLRVGKDIAVTGFDDWERAVYLEPPLTTVRQDSYGMGCLALESALELYQGKPRQELLVPCRLMRRESCGDTGRQVPEAGEIRALHDRMKRLFVQAEDIHRSYKQKSWLVSLSSGSMMSHIGREKEFYRAALKNLSALGAGSSYLLLFEEPIVHRKGDEWKWPQRFLLAAYQEGNTVISYDREHFPEVPLAAQGGILDRKEPYSMSLFCLFSGEVQYGVLMTQIEPETIDIMYLISMQIGNALMVYDINRKRSRAEREREVLLKKLREKNEVLNFISEYDALTEIFNRRGFMEQAVEQNRKNCGRKAVFLYADMDHLKEINDGFGHSEGDFAIHNCAQILKAAVGENGIAGRLGGDEFGLMVFGDAVLAEELIARVHKECRRFNASSGKEYGIEVSMGFKEVVCRQDLSIADVMKAADQSLYRAKRRR